MSRVGTLLIHSDAGGHPTRSGSFLHWVSLSDGLYLPPINQMTSGFPYASMACAGASVMCQAEALDAPRIPTPYELVVVDEGNTGSGVGIPGIIRGYAACGLIAVARFATPDWATQGMNSAWGGELSGAAAIAPYLPAAATAWPDGWFVEVIGTTAGESSVSIVYYEHKRPDGTVEHHRFTCDANGNLVDGKLDQNDWHDHATVMTGCKPFSAIAAADLDGVQNVHAWDKDGVTPRHAWCDPHTGIWTESPRGDA